MHFLGYIGIGLLTGFVGGALGIGGGAIMIPLFVFMMGMTQHQAQGTSLAVMVLPITFMAAYRYYIGGNVKLPIVLFVAGGFAIGALCGAHVIQDVSGPHLKKAFGIFMVLVGLKMIFIK